MSYIYLVTNNVNGKQYVGQHHYHGKGLDPTYTGSGTALKCAYRKYGQGSFSITLLEECDDSELDTLEMMCIKKIGTKSPDGYNLTDGGGGGTGRKYTPEQRENMKIGQNRPDVKERKRKSMLGRKLSASTVSKISESKRELYKDPEKRKQVSEHLRKVRPAVRKERIFICPLKLAFYAKQHLFLQELANVFGCDYRIVKRRAKKYGIPLEPRNPWLGRHHTEEYKRYMSKVIKEIRNNKNYGKHTESD